MTKTKEEKKEDYEILTDAYKQAEELISEALGILQDAHAETETDMDCFIEQELSEGYGSNLRQELIDRTDKSYWDDTYEDDDEEEANSDSTKVEEANKN